MLPRCSPDIDPILPYVLRLRELVREAENEFAGGSGIRIGYLLGVFVANLGEVMVENEELRVVCVVVEAFGEDRAEGSDAGRFAKIGADDQIGVTQGSRCSVGILLILDDRINARKPRKEVGKRGWHDVCNVCFAEAEQEVPHSQTTAQGITVRILVSDDGNRLCIGDATCRKLKLKGRNFVRNGCVIHKKVPYY